MFRHGDGDVCAAEITFWVDRQAIHSLAFVTYSTQTYFTFNILFQIQ